MGKRLCGIVVTFVVAVTRLAAQPAAAPRFEVASVKVSAPGTQMKRRGGPGTGEPERITYRNFPLSPVIQTAYGMNVLGPDWLPYDRFDILANVPANTTEEDVRRMMQTLLRERFGLTAHVEQRSAPSYDLVIAKASSRLKEWKEGPNDPALPPLTPLESNGLKRDPNGITHMPAGRSGMAQGFNVITGSGHLEAVQVPIGEFAKFVSGRVGMPVSDRTGLTGKYSFTIDFQPSGLSGSAPANQDASEPTADILTALRLQLGLKLEKKETPVNVLVIDKIERRPVGN
jgi:uncharacterized protein (TIGR03435 family)